MKNLSTLLLALLTVVAVTGPASAVPSFIGGTIINAPQAEGCCGGGSLFNFNGGVGDITGIVNTTQVGLDNRSGGDGVYNGQTNVAATFFITAPAGQGQLTGFQVMNSTNGQFDDRQTGQFQIDVSTNGGLTFTNSVVNTVLNIAANTGADDPAPMAQQFNIAPITLHPTPSQNVIRITSQQAATQSGAGVSLSEFRSIVNDGPFISTFFIGGTIINAPQAEGCCAGGSLFNFNGGQGSLVGVSPTNQVGLDSRNGDGVYNGVVNQAATFSIAPPAGTTHITGFEVMNSTNAQFDDRQTGQFRIEVSTNGGGTFTTVVDQLLNTVDMSLSGDQPAPLAQQFLIAPIGLNPLAGQNIIRITSVTASGASAVSLAEFRTIVSTIPEPASLSLIGLAALSMGMRRRRVA